MEARKYKGAFLDPEDQDLLEELRKMIDVKKKNAGVDYTKTSYSEVITMAIRTLKKVLQKELAS